MNKRKRLGQHMLADRGVLVKIVEHAGIGRKEVVFEIGTGSGILTAELCKKAARVISCEVDPELAAEAAKKLAFANLTLIRGDGFRTCYDFDLFVSNLPYSRSRRTVEWLAERSFDRAIVLVQSEFADKLLAEAGSRNYRAVSALARYCFGIERLMSVGRHCFVPRPRVDSVLLRLRKARSLGQDTVKALKILFSFRGKKLGAAMRKIGLDIDSEKRVETLSPDEAVGLAEEIVRRRLVQAVG